MYRTRSSRVYSLPNNATLLSLPHVLHVIVVIVEIDPALALSCQARAAALSCSCDTR